MNVCDVINMTCAMCWGYRYWGCRCCRAKMEMRGIEPRAFHMQSEHSTTELHPHVIPE